MVDTGIKPTDDVYSEFSNLRMKRTHRYMIMKMSSDKSSIEIEKLGAREEGFEQFKEAMPKDECR